MGVLPEVFGGFRSNIGEELHFDSAGGDVADRDVEEYNRVLGAGWPLVPVHQRAAIGSDA